MTQDERDRLVALKKARRKLITQREAAEELEVSERHVRRLLGSLAEHGDKSVIHGLMGQVSNRRIDEKTERAAVKILSGDVYRDFGPTLAAEYLSQKHDIEVSKETLRQWMIRGKLWRAKKEKNHEVHLWRPRRSRFGELVQWDTSTHDWLEGRGEQLYLIAMIDDATSRLLVRFVRHDSTEENMRMVWSYIERYGRPVMFYTDKASLFQTAEKTKWGRRREPPDGAGLGPTQIHRALQELGIGWQAAHSPQAKGRVERNFGTAQDRLVKGLRVAGVKAMEPANRYLEEEYLPWWQTTLTGEPASPDNAHRPLDKHHNLAASLSHVETRHVRNDYTVRFENRPYQIERAGIVSGLRGAEVRVEKRLDGELAMRFRERYLKFRLCEEAPKAAGPVQASGARKRAQQRGSDWNHNFDLNKGPKIWQAAQQSGYRGGDSD